MNTATPPFASTIHRVDSAIHCFGPTAGEIRLNVRMAGEATEDEVCQNLRLAIPGEVGLLQPREVRCENDVAAVGFFSSDIANSGHIPASMELHWNDAGCVYALDGNRIRSATDVTGQADANDARVPGGHPVSNYPKTVTSALSTALIVGALVIGTALVLIF